MLNLWTKDIPLLTTWHFRQPFLCLVYCKNEQKDLERKREREMAMEWNVMLLCVQTVFVIGQNKFGIFKFVQSKHSCSARSPSPLLSLPCQLFLDRLDVHIRFDSVKIPSHALQLLYRALMYFYLLEQKAFSSYVQ